ncbi:MAG TPA: hypothetical protein VG963_31620, partial [Polyangiaceae bacterium]|nr:hypothetical protein [Polyangiaceae bacterium]
SQPVMSDNGGESSFWSQRTVGYITLGVGGAGLAVGSVTGILAIERRHDLMDIKCAQVVGNHCYVVDRTSAARQYASDKKQQMDRYAKIATISFIAGGAVAATGLILLLTAPDDPGTHASEPAFLPYVGFGTIGAVGSF